MSAGKSSGNSMGGGQQLRGALGEAFDLLAPLDLPSNTSRDAAQRALSAKPTPVAALSSPPAAPSFAATRAPFPPPRRAPPAKRMKEAQAPPPAAPQPIFAGCTILLCRTVTPGPREVFYRTIPSLGGTLVNEPCAAMTHVVVAKAPSHATAAPWQATAPHVLLVHQAWLQKCLDLMARLPEEPYQQLWPLPPAAPVPMPVAASEPPAAPSPHRKSAEGGSGGTVVCYNCHQAGHLAGACNNPPKDIKEAVKEAGAANPPVGAGVCYRCGEAGHWMAACPKSVASPFLSMSPFAYACQPHKRAGITRPDVAAMDANLPLAAAFKDLAQMHKFDAQNRFRVTAYRNAAKAVQSLDFKVADNVARTLAVLQWTPSSSCAKLLVEWVETSRIQKLEELRMQYSGVLALQGVFGIGPAHAQTLHARGITSLEELRAQVAADEAAGKPRNTLSAAQLAGLQHYDDLKQRVPRHEVEALVRFVQGHAEAVAPGCEVHGMGSFRRGASHSGDVDILMTHADDEVAHGLMGFLLPRLQASGLVLAVLAASGTRDGQVAESEAWTYSFMLIVRLPADAAAAAGIEGPLRARRMDLKVYPKSRLPFALLYFTGSDQFNRNLRFWAKQNLFSLSDKGLVTCLSRFSGSLKADYSTSLPATCENDIFRHLHLEYVEPKDRCV